MQHYVCFHHNTQENFQTCRFYVTISHHMWTNVGDGFISSKIQVLRMQYIFLSDISPLTRLQLLNSAIFSSIQNSFEEVLVWFGLSLYGHFLHTRANQTGTYCLKWIPNHYKHPSPKRKSNSRTAKLKTTELAIQPQLAEYKKFFLPDSPSDTQHCGAEAA